MSFTAGFFRFAAACALLSAITTLGVHLIPGAEKAVTFEQRIALHADPVYIARLGNVLVHILLVIASMWGVAAAKRKTAAGFMGLGFLGYLLFALAEIFRTSLGLFMVNRGWRARFAGADEATQNELRTLLSAWPGINDALFFLLVLGFFIGNLFYGSVLVRGAGFERTLGTILLFWAALGFYGMANGFLGAAWLPDVPDFVAWTFQPAVRVLIAIWLWGVAASVTRESQT